MSAPPDVSWADAASVAALFAVDPIGTGVAVRARAGPSRDRWLRLVREVLPTVPVRKLPLHVADDRLLGGIDLAASLRSGRAVAEPGLLARADGCILQLAMAERMPAGTAARIGAVLDTGDVATIRGGVALRSPTRFGVIALDEGSTMNSRRPHCSIAWRSTFGLTRCLRHPHRAPLSQLTTF